MLPRIIVLLVAASAVTAAAAATNNKRLSAFKLKPGAGAACTKQCQPNHVCEIQTCNVCVPEPRSCRTHVCTPDHKCEDTRDGPVCVRLTCADIKCAAGFLCNELPDGPDCVPDVPSCEGFFCKRGTNCYVRDGSPKCLPNTCEVRICEHGLTCIDTHNGALCKRGKQKKTCKQIKYCPANSECKEFPEGAHCVKI